MAAPPPLRPGVGFCVQTESTGNPPGRWFLNMCGHRIVDMPIAYSGKPATKEWILTHGISNMQVPFDCGTFRKIKARADGAKQTTYCIDVVFNPFIIRMFMDDDFNKTMEQYRPFVIGLALKRIEESVGVKLSTEKVKLVKNLRYKDAEDDDGVTPKEFIELDGTADSFDAEAPKKDAPKAEDTDTGPLIEDVTPGAKKSKPAIKKGFLNKGGGSLYGDEGSKEGVLPENAGDPMGWMPKKLRNSCKIVDCNDPEYQKNEAARRSAESSNSMNQEFRDTMAKDMEKWAKASQGDKWGEDLPEGTDEPRSKYSNDYSRFDNITDVEDPKGEEQRDWFCDTKGDIRRMDGSKAMTSCAMEAPSTDEAAAKDYETLRGLLDAPPAQAAMKKGFLEGAKALYPKGSEQAKAPLMAGMDDSQMLKEMQAMLGGQGGSGDQAKLMKEMEAMLGGQGGDMGKAMEAMLGGQGGGDMAKAMEAMLGGQGGDMGKALEQLAAAGMGGKPPATKPVEAKVPERKAPEYELNQVAEGLQLAVSVPGLTSMQGVNLDVTEKRASLAFPGSVGLKPLQVDLPSAVSPTEVRAKFSKKTQRITVTLPTACH